MSSASSAPRSEIADSSNFSRHASAPFALFTVFGTLVVLLAALAVVQYRWSGRVAAADIQREKEHLDSAASLFASEFDGLVAQAAEFLQEGARSSLQSSTQLSGLPKLIEQLYYVDTGVKGNPTIKHLGADGLFAPSAAPERIARYGCAAVVPSEPPAVVVPIYEVTRSEDLRESGIKVFRAISRRPGRCFVGIMDLAYLRNSVFPQLIQQSFGETTTAQYDFAVKSQASPPAILYGTAKRSDLIRPFFLPAPLPRAIATRPIEGFPKDAFFVEHFQVTVKDSGSPPKLLGPGIWELEIARKGLPLAAAFERTRQMDMLFSLTVESLLIAGIVFLVITARRMHRLADQKMHFVAGVSHELRTPVSAIAMLSRNQADGLVTGADKVKQYGELIHEQSRRLSEMVEQTLQYAGIHSGLRRSVKNEIDLGGLIREAVEARREELERSGFEIELALSAELPKFVGDPNLLWTAFDNLLNNAQKYAGSGHWIRVSAGYSVDEKEVQISVEDRGAGIDAADQAEIFEPFSRGKAAMEAQIPGSGLGLSLVRSAAKAHRGAVTLESAPGRGSTFTLHLPV